MPTDMPDRNQFDDVPPLREAEAWYNMLCLSEKVYREIFRPGLGTVFNPSDYEQLLMDHASRLSGILAGMVKLNAPKHLPLAIGGIRTVFEIAVDIELVLRPKELFPHVTDSEAEIVRRHRVLWKRQSVKLFHVLAKNPNQEVAQAAKAALKRREPSAEEEEERVFGQVRHNRRHWLTDELSERVKTLGRKLGNDKFWHWYEMEYRLASHHAHGPLTVGTEMARDGEGIRTSSTVFFPWASELLAKHIMQPIWRRFELNKADPGGWRRLISLPEETAKIYVRVMNQELNEDT